MRHDELTSMGSYATMVGGTFFLRTEERPPGLTPRAGARCGAAGT